MYQEIINRCKEQCIDIEGCHVYIDGVSFDDKMCMKGTLSQDEEWICIPILYYDESLDMEIYYPKCFQIKEKLQTYLKSDSMWKLREIYILYKEK